MIVHLLKTSSTLRWSLSSLFSSPPARLVRFASVQSVRKVLSTKPGTATKPPHKSLRTTTSSPPTSAIRHKAVTAPSTVSPAPAAGRSGVYAKLDARLVDILRSTAIGPNSGSISRSASAVLSALGEKPIERALARKRARDELRKPYFYGDWLVTLHGAHADHGSATTLVAELQGLGSKSEPPVPAATTRTAITPKTFTKRTAPVGSSFSAHSVGLGVNPIMAFPAGQRFRRTPSRQLSPVAAAQTPLNPRARASHLTTSSSAPPALTDSEWYALLPSAQQNKFRFDQGRGQYRNLLHSLRLAIEGLSPEDAANPLHSAFERWDRACKAGPGEWDGVIREPLARPKGVETLELTVERRVVWEPTDGRKRGSLHNERDYDLGDRAEVWALRKFFRAKWSKMKLGSPFMASYARLSVPEPGWRRS